MNIFIITTSHLNEKKLVKVIVTLPLLLLLRTEKIKNIQAIVEY